MTQNTEQNVRTRREQLAIYPESVCVGRYSGNTLQLELDGDDLDPDQLVEGPVLYVRCDIAHRCQTEAEARGAAEQRRKDAEKQEPVAWLISDRLKGKPGCAHIVDRATTNRAYAEYQATLGFDVMPLCSKGSNVAALEARVKELEEVLSHLLETEEVTDPGKPRILDLAYTAFLSGFCGKNPDDGGKCDWFTDTRPQIMRHIEKARAALTREGGV